MTVEELAPALKGKSEEVYWEHCGEDTMDEFSQLEVKYWEGWADALKDVVRFMETGEWSFERDERA